MKQASIVNWVNDPHVFQLSILVMNAPMKQASIVNWVNDPRVFQDVTLWESIFEVEPKTRCLLHLHEFSVGAVTLFWLRFLCPGQYLKLFRH